MGIGACVSGEASDRLRHDAGQSTCFHGVSKECLLTTTVPGTYIIIIIIIIIIIMIIIIINS